MTTDHLKTIFTNYLDEPKTQYAILINGKWGSGKTYYWKNELKALAESKQYKTIYISLNGISSTHALQELLFYKLIPFIRNSKNKHAEKITKLIGNSINAASRHFIKTDLSDLFKGIGLDSFNFDKYVICFDDLERCQIPIKETLGFINNYTEHKNLKTIIFADESNIDTTQSGYDNIKEKVIGRILNFQLDIKESISLLSDNYKTKNTDFHNFLYENRELISSTFINYQQDNLRITSFYFKVLETLFPIIKEVDNQYRDEIIFFSALITIEFKLGNLKSDEYADPKGIQNIDRYYNFNPNFSTRNSKSKEEEEEEPEKIYSIIFYEKYLNEKVNDYFFYSSVFTFILSGYFDEKNLREEIKNRYPEIITEEILAFRELLTHSFRALPNEVFNDLVKKVINYARKGMYSIYDYAQIAQFYYFFSESGLYQITTEEVTQVLKEGLINAEKQKKIDEKSLRNLRFFSESDVRISQIQKEIEKIHNDIQKEIEAIEGNELVAILKTDDTNALSALFNKQNYSTKVFRNLNKNELCSSLLHATNKQLYHFIDLLDERYKAINIGEFLSDDYKILNDVKNLLNSQLMDIEPQPQRFLLKEVVRTLGIASDNLDKTKK